MTRRSAPAWRRPFPTHARICSLLAYATLLACSDSRAGELYVTSGQSDEVIRLDAVDGSVVRRVPVDRLPRDTDEPHAVAVAPDGLHWYATVAHGQPSFWKFETEGDRLVGRLDLPSGGAAMIGLSPDGTTAFIPDYDRAGDRVGRVAAVRLHDLSVARHEAICGAPHDAAVHPSGDVLAIACSGSHEVLFLDPVDLSVIRRMAAPARPASDSTAPEATHEGHSTAGSRPFALTWSPGGERLAVALHSLGAVWLLDRAGVTERVIPIDAGPAQLAFRDERTLVSANRMGGSLSIVDLERGVELRRIALDAQFPHGVVLSEDRSTAYVAFEGTPELPGGVVAIDVESGERLWRAEIGRYVLGIAYLPAP